MTTMQTINDVTAAVAERFGVGITEDGLELAVRAAVPGRYEDVELSDAFLRSVWSAWQPDAAYPFGGVSEELAGGLAAYSARIDALGGYGARVRATMPNGVVREGVRPRVELGAAWLAAVAARVCTEHDDCAACAELGEACAAGRAA